jgi:hypothetical protein
MDSLTSLPHFELKYCERCGGLWLRPDGAAALYCSHCAHFMADLPLRPPRNQRKPARRALDTAVVSLFTLLVNLPPDLMAGWCA